MHPAVVRQHADPADAPVERLAVVHQAVEVHRLVGPVEAADPEVHDAAVTCDRSYAGRATARDPGRRAVAEDSGDVPVT